jgi:aryl-alcohol dehydrogenase-like predicted oxidoreductase
MRSADGYADPCEIRASLERSLLHLKKDYVDLIQLHAPS